MRKRKIVLYGAGSLGSWLAYFISHLVGEIQVIDKDTVDSSNIAGGRTIYSRKHLGMSKVQALKECLENGFPHLKVIATKEDINEISDIYLQDIFNADMIICAVDDIECILRINNIYYGKRPIIYGGFMRQAAEGFVSVITKNTPCFRCCLKLQAERFQTLHREPGLGLDISLIAHYMSKLVISILDTSDTDFSRDVRKAIREGTNLLHISNRRGILSSEPFSVTWLRPERQRCSICNNKT
jgi:molybdopterin/thiamine biosynthesis adenylyltransferase